MTKEWKKPELKKLPVSATLGGALGGFPETFDTEIGGVPVEGAS